MRTSKAVAVLDKHEAALKTERELLHAKLDSIELSLERVKQMRADMQALPKRTSKAKNRVVAAANAAPPTATAA